MFRKVKLSTSDKLDAQGTIQIGFAAVFKQDLYL